MMQKYTKTTLILMWSAVAVGLTISDESRSADYPPGERTFVHSTISVVAENGQPAVDEEVYTAESIGNYMKLSSLMHSDKEGNVVFSGYYCLPMEVVVSGSTVVIHQGETKERYTLYLHKEGPGAIEIYGRSDKTIFDNVETLRRTCLN